MAQLKITGVDGTVSVSNIRAARIADDKKNMPLSQQKEMWIDLGTWQGYLSKIQSVLIERERELTQDFNRPLTPEERESHADVMARVRSNLEAKGIIPKKVAPPLE